MTSPSEKDYDENTYQGSLAALFSPLHQATTKEEIAKSAARRVHTVTDMRIYWESLSLPEIKESSLLLPKRVIHITGTKGKGSTACMCEAILRAHGYSTGLFTSPHLIDIRERIRWNGKPIHSNIFASAYWNIRKDLEAAAIFDDNDNNEGSLPPRLPGYFRYLTLMAYWTFAKLQVDVMIIEVGMGGRYDATNFIDFLPNDYQVACGVTLLDLDHTRVLGNTLEQIAWEKGGIFAIYDKASTTNITPKPKETEANKNDNGEYSAPNNTGDDNDNDDGKESKDADFFILDSNKPSVLHMFQQCAQNEGRGTTLQTVDAKGSNLQKHLNGAPLGLAGQHQYGNATLAVHLCQRVTRSKEIQLGNATTLEALKNASWPARCQTVQQDQRIFRLDGAHTPQSLGATMKWFTQQQRTDLPSILVFNTSHERNPVELLQLLIPAGFTKVYFAKSDSSRPSPVNIPTAKELLEADGIVWNPDIMDSITPTGGTCTWQETLGIIWKHLQRNHTNENSQSAEVVEVECNMTASQVLMDMANLEAVEVLVTGSLYLVGSFLTAIDWKEESSPDL